MTVQQKMEQDRRRQMKIHIATELAKKLIEQGMVLNLKIPFIAASMADAILNECSHEHGNPAEVTVPEPPRS